MYELPIKRKGTLETGHIFQGKASCIHSVTFHYTHVQCPTLKLLLLAPPSNSIQGQTMCIKFTKISTSTHFSTSQIITQHNKNPTKSFILTLIFCHGTDCTCVFSCYTEGLIMCHPVIDVTLKSLLLTF
jgi:hypothetical protein